MLGVATIAHVHANDVATGLPCPRGQPQHVARTGRPFESVNQDRRQTFCAHRLRLPVAMTENLASVSWIDEHDFSRRRLPKRRPRQEVADDCLYVAVEQSTTRLKSCLPSGCNSWSASAYRLGIPASRKSWVGDRSGTFSFSVCDPINEANGEVAVIESFQQPSLPVSRRSYVSTCVSRG